MSSRAIKWGLIAGLPWVIVTAQAQEDQNTYTEADYEAVLEKVEVAELANQPQLLTYESDCSGQKGGGADLSPGVPNPFREGITPKPPVSPNPGIPTPVRPTPYPGRPSYGTSELDQIINAGLKIWSFIRDNSPTVTSKHSYANALPKGITCWNELEGWSVPRSEIYRLTLSNKWTKRDDVVFDFRLVYQWGGNVGGIGHYLTNVTVDYKRLNAAWGVRSVDADVEIPLATNVGTKADPVAGLQVKVNWTVKTSNHRQGSESFFVFGDGRPSEQIE